MEKKFKNILTLGIDSSSLDSHHWNRIDSLTERRVSLSGDSKEIYQELSGTDCLLVAFGIPVTRELITAAPNLKYIGVMATAYNMIDVVYAREHNISVCNLIDYCTEAVAEFSFAVILDHLRQLDKLKKMTKTTKYSEVKTISIANMHIREIKNSIFGVIGLGHIGGRVAQIAAAFGADVRYHARSEKCSPYKFEKDLVNLIAQADFISINLPLTRETKNIINATHIKRIKHGVVVLNTSPMELIDISAMMERLSCGDITFIFDHFDPPFEKRYPQFSRYKNCHAYRMVGYITDESTLMKQKIFVENVESFLFGKPQNIVSY